VVRGVASFAVVFGVFGVGQGTFGISREPGCGGADSPSSGQNAPCTRSKDCSAGLTCAEGVCKELDSGSTPIVPDGGRDADSDASDDGG
jgi:hypothetical protein